MSFKYALGTFGCKVNSYDSGLMQKQMQQAGLRRDESHPDVYVINSCAVTAEATAEAIRHARKFKIKNPNSVVVVTGCAAQVDSDKIEKAMGVDLIIANSHKSMLPEIIKDRLNGQSQQRLFRSNIFHKTDLEVGGGIESSHTRSFLKIQDGCDSFCTFCVIPFARGKSRSVPIDVLVERARELYDQGFRELVLTGVHIGDYVDVEFGENHSRRLEDLIEQILVRTRFPRVRLTSLEPPEVSDRLLGLFEEPRICPHFHMSIQSGSSTVLKAMKRQYSAETVRKSLYAIEQRVPSAFVGMDVIAGFPSETEDQFCETFELLEQSPWTRLHVFPYSERPGTFARRIQPKVEEKVVAARARRLRELSYDRWKTVAARMVNQERELLIIGDRQKGLSGISKDFWTVRFKNEIPNQHSRGDFALARIVGVEASHKNSDIKLIGEFLRN